LKNGKTLGEEISRFYGEGDYMIVFETTKRSIDIAKRLDVNFWAPQKNKVASGIQSNSLRNIVGSGSLWASAFYPSITPFYQTLDNSEDTLPFIRVKDVRKMMLDFSETVFINSEILDKFSANIKRVRPRDILITKGGEYIGEASLVPNYYNEYAFCRDVLAIHTANSSLCPEYLTSYFQSEIGKADLIRTKSVQGQPHLTLDKLYDLEIPYISHEFECDIKGYWDSFYSLIDEANACLAAAKTRLNDCLLKMLDVKETMDYFEMSYTAVDFALRGDFEFYQAKWFKLVKMLKASGIEFEEVKFETENIDKSIPQKVYRYVTISDIDDRSGIITRFKELPTHMLPGRAQRKVSYNDLLVSSLKGSKDKIALVEEDSDNLVASNGFYVVRSDTIRSEVLYLLFRSKFYDLFIEQMASGAIMSSITNKYFTQLELPILDGQDQESIATDIQNYLTKWQFAFEKLEIAAQLFDKQLTENTLP